MGISPPAIHVWVVAGPVAIVGCGPIAPMLRLHNDGVAPRPPVLPPPAGVGLEGVCMHAPVLVDHDRQWGQHFLPLAVPDVVRCRGVPCRRPTRQAQARWMAAAAKGKR